MGAGASIQDKEEWACLLQQMSTGMHIKQETKEEINPPNSQMRGTITRISYSAFGVRLENTDKILYFARFPPTDGTVVPLMEEPSSEYDLKVDDDVTAEEVIEYWSSKDTRQLNGMWKGGSWGIDNFMYASQVWCTGAFVGDTIIIDFVKNGVIKFAWGVAFSPEGGQEPLPKTLNSAWSCNLTVEKTGGVYAGYAMNFMMPQYANDLLFIWKDQLSGKRMVKICKVLMLIAFALLSLFFLTFFPIPTFSFLSFLSFLSFICIFRGATTTQLICRISTCRERAST